MIMRVLSHSQPSHPNRENQDHIEIRCIAGARLIALADGAGGQAGGALAARIAVESALSFLEQERDPFDFDALLTAISLADEAVEAHPDAGFSTLIVMACDETQAVGASVGDSVVLYIQGDGEVELSERQRKNPPLGSGGCLGTPFKANVSANEQILAISDGVYRFVGTERLAQTCRKSDDLEAMPHLLALQLRANGELPDDWSAVLVRF